MHEMDLIFTLTGGLTAALAFGYATFRLGLSPIVGYLLAGIAVGEFTPGFVADRHLAEQMAEIGVILLMFGVGLNFHVEELLAVRWVAIPGAIGQILFATALGAVVLVAFGGTWTAGVLFGLAISVASTVVLIRVLTDNRDLHTPAGHIAVGWLVVEDLFTVLVLVLMPALLGDQAGESSILLALGLALVKVSAMVALILLAGGRILPWVLEHVARTRSRELFTLTILVIALGLAVGSALLFGVSMALGAFLAGMVVGRSDFSLRAASEALPMRDAFAVLFFVSIGMLLDPQHLLRAPGLALATVAVVVVGKPLAALAIMLLLRYPLMTALTVSVALAQIGEFSFILAVLGKELLVLSDADLNTLVVAAIASITINPVLYRLLGPLQTWLNASGRGRWLRAFAPAADSDRSTKSPPSRKDSRKDPRHRAVLVGYGPVGQTLARLLRENDIEPTIVELNLETVQKVRAEGMTAIYGDASQLETLQAAGVEGAGSLILSSAGLSDGESVIRQARTLNPGLQILARTVYVRELQGLRQAGADAGFSGEGEVALAMAVTLLHRLGATPEQIDRERERVRRTLGVAVPES